MIKFKKGVKVEGLQPEIVAVFTTLNTVFMNYCSSCTITSGTDKVQKRASDSKHPRGYAIDIRIRHLDEYAVAGIVDDLKQHLTDEYTVILNEDHIHLHFNPSTLNDQFI